MYGKIVDGYIKAPPKQFKENGQIIVGFTDSFLRERGYKPVVFSNPPDDDKTYRDVYSEDDNRIYQSWEEEE